jgi:hypothetical protein
MVEIIKWEKGKQFVRGGKNGRELRSRDRKGRERWRTLWYLGGGERYADKG